MWRLVIFMQTEIAARSAVKDTIKSPYFLPLPSRATALPALIIRGKSIHLIILRSTTRTYHLGYPFNSVQAVKWYSACCWWSSCNWEKESTLTEGYTRRLCTPTPSSSCPCSAHGARAGGPVPTVEAHPAVEPRAWCWEESERVREDGRSRIFWSGSDWVYARPDRIC